MPRLDLRFPPLTLPESTEQLRADLRAFLAEELASGGFTSHADSWLGGFSPEFSRKLGARGWVGLTWPKKYGGQERSSLDRYVVTEEMLAVGAPVTAHWIADRQSGPLLLRFGTEAQRERFLPPIARGESYFAIGMSEPDSGSDLASIRSQARPVDGGWRLTGQKIWTSHAHHSHYAITLCRTEPAGQDRHAGMSQFVVPLDSPGVTIRPIRLLTGDHHFNEIIFDDVFLADDLLVGQAGQGWAQVMTELAFERSGPERILSTFPLISELVRVIGKTPDDRAAVTIGQLTARVWTLRQMSLAVAGLLNAGVAPEVEAALVKDLGTRFEQASIEIARQLSPFEPSLTAEDRFAVLLAEATLHSPGFTLRGGTTEVLRGVVARALGVR